MITNEQYKNYLPGNHPMGDLNNNFNIGTWPVYYGEKPPSNGQFQDPHVSRTIADAYFGYRTESVRQKMIEHEAIFQTQLYELHRLYGVQRKLMDDMKMNELQKQSMATETSMSSCSVSRRPDAQRRFTSLPFPLSSSSSAQPAVVGVKNFHSISNFYNGRHPQNGLVSTSNPGNSGNCELEIFGCRPSTAKRQFDLELKADEYIDLEDPKYRSERIPCMSHYLSNGSREVPSGSSKMCLSQSIKIDSRGDEARKNKGEIGLANLNEQIQTQGLNSSPVNFVEYNSNFRSNQQLCTESLLQNAWDSMPNSHFGRDAYKSRNHTTAHGENGREWSHILDSVRGKGQSNVFSQNLLPENIDFFNKDRNASYFQTNQIKAEDWKERSECGPKHSGNSFLNSLNNPHLDKSFTTSKAPWQKSGGCVTQKSVTDEAYPFVNSSRLPQSLQSSSRSAQVLVESWHINSGSGLNGAYPNGLYKGSCSGSGPACRPTVGYNYLNCSNDQYVASGASICQNGSVKFRGLTSVDVSSARGIDLNITIVADKHDYDDRPNLDNVAHLPWVKSSTGLKIGNGTTESSNGCIMRQQNTGHASSAHDMAMKATTSNLVTGVPIFGDNHLSIRSLSCCSSLSKEEEMGKNGRVRDFDMNLPCDEEKDAEAPAVIRRNLIDLNMCVEDDDVVVEIPAPSYPVATVRGFDLEASGDIEEEDMIQLKHQKSENSDGGLVTTAAEALVGISSCRKLIFADTPRNLTVAKQPDILKWFVDIISSFPDDADIVLTDNSEEETDSVDYFESMTLQLAETKEDEYFPEYPKPPEPEEEMGAGLYTTRTRKGQARRGRPRRDFQRDILPGLTSLARHEVTEDLQTFGGLMRATGHSWQSSITRRPGPRRGRPRLTPPVPLPPLNPFSTPNLSSPSCPPLPPKKPPSPFCSPSPQKRRTITPKEVMNMEEDHGNLTGWGKTTRRPRRQPRRQLCSTASCATPNLI